jgi:hypothetical protein
MGMENGAPIGDDLANLAYFRKRGIPVGLDEDSKK